MQMQIGFSIGVVSILGDDVAFFQFLQVWFSIRAKSEEAVQMSQLKVSVNCYSIKGRRSASGSP